MCPAAAAAGCRGPYAPSLLQSEGAPTLPALPTANHLPQLTPSSSCAPASVLGMSLKRAAKKKPSTKVCTSVMTCMATAEGEAGMAH